MRTYLFDDGRSVGHAILGIISAIVPVYLGIPIIISYVVYEVKEPENPIATIGDIVEFIIGFIIGAMITGG